MWVTWEPIIAPHFRITNALNSYSLLQCKIRKCFFLEIGTVRAFDNEQNCNCVWTTEFLFKAQNNQSSSSTLCTVAHTYTDRLYCFASVAIDEIVCLYPFSFICLAYSYAGSVNIQTSAFLTRCRMTQRNNSNVRMVPICTYKYTIEHDTQMKLLVSKAISIQNFIFFLGFLNGKTSRRFDIIERWVFSLLQCCRLVYVACNKFA